MAIFQNFAFKIEPTSSIGTIYPSLEMMYIKALIFLK